MESTHLRFVWFLIGLGLLSAHLDARFVQPNDDAGADPLKIRENLRDLLNSIDGNNRKNIKMYHNILRREVGREKGIFDAVKGNWRSAQKRNAGVPPNLLHESDIGGEVAVNKREIEPELLARKRQHWKKTYEQDDEILEKWYLDLHPDTNDIQWPQVKNLLQKTHRKICDKVFHDLQPYYDQYKFEDELPTDPEAPSKKVRGPELLELKKEMLAIPVVECVYNRNASLITEITPKQTILYLTHANSSRVFTLSKDKWSDIFYLQTGLHAVSYSTKD